MIQDESPRDTSAVLCPYCDSAETELISQFGSQLLLSQRRCRHCRSYFEALSDSLKDETECRPPG
jgi:translation initiation factor 2 beta subunit (eIF-2beta)/eIF-5